MSSPLRSIRRRKDLALRKKVKRRETALLKHIKDALERKAAPVEAPEARG